MDVDDHGENITGIDDQMSTQKSNKKCVFVNAYVVNDTYLFFNEMRLLGKSRSR
jgi:hypothetical protein